MAGMIFTIGYGNRSFNCVADLLQRERVDFLIDVRSNPLSRFNPEFSREQLDRLLRDLGIRYLFMGDALGGRPEDSSCYENGHVIYGRVRQKEFFCKGIDRLHDAWTKGFRLGLLCSEIRPEQCHRSKLIGVALADRGTDVMHLDGEGKCVSQSEVLLRLQHPQHDLFGAELCSRKAYRSKASAMNNSATSHST
jgi:uncharacterized protein (DUF488 family)